MKKSILLIAAFLCCFSIYAQSIIKSGPLTKKSMKDAFMDVHPLGHFNGNYYYMLYPFSYFMKNTVGTTRDFQIGMVNSNMEMEKSAPVDFKTDGKERSFEFSHQFGEDVYIFSSLLNEDENSILFAQKLNKETLLLEDPIKIIETPQPEGTKIKTSSFSAKFSPDQSKMLINYELGDKDGDLIAMGIIVLDNKLKHLYSIPESALTVDDGIYVFERYLIDNSGNVYMTARYYEDNKEYKKSAKYKKKWFLSGTSTLIANAVYDYKLLQLSKTGVVKTYDLSLDDKFVATLEPGINSQNQVICAGLYSQPGNTSVRGSFLFKIDPKGKKVISTSSDEFSLNFITEGMKEKDAEKVKEKMTENEPWEEYQYITEGVVHRKDGSFALIVEQFMKQSKTVTSGRTVSTYTVFKTDNILVINYDANGKASWTQKVIKQQETVDYGYMYFSFVYDQVGDDIFFLFTDLNKKSVNMLGTFKRSEATVVKLDSNGSQERKTLFNMETEGVTLRAADTQKISSGKMVVLGQLNNAKYKFLNVSLN